MWRKAACWATALSVVSCGGSQPLTLPPRPSTSTASTVPAAGSLPAASATAPVPGATVVPGATSGPQVSASASWVPAVGSLEGLESECGNMSYVSSRPDRDMLIAGVALRGLWASTDGGATWTPLGEAGGSDAIINRTSAIIYDPEVVTRFWESGIYNGGAAYRTDDDGASFRGLGDITHSDLVSIDFSDPERATLLSGTHELPTVYRSADGGATWQDVSAGLPDDVGFAISPLVLDAQTHLLGTRSGAAAGIFRTTDGAATWQRVHTGGVSSPPLVASDGSIYWSLEAGGGLVRSVDGGATWTLLPGRIIGTPSLLELPDGTLVAMTDKHLTLSSDQGKRWMPIGPEFPYQPAGFAYSTFRNTFYIWRFDCNLGGENPVPPDAIMGLALDA